MPRVLIWVIRCLKGCHLPVCKRLFLVINNALANKILLLTGGRNNGLIGIIEGKKGVKIQFSGRKYSSL